MMRRKEMNILKSFTQEKISSRRSKYGELKEYWKRKVVYRKLIKKN